VVLAAAVVLAALVVLVRLAALVGVVLAEADLAADLAAE